MAIDAPKPAAAPEPLAVDMPLQAKLRERLSAVVAKTGSLPIDEAVVSGK
jgi:hypothetical protein